MAKRSAATALKRAVLAGLLILAAVIAAGMLRGAEGPADPPKSTRWGPKDQSGLQLGAWLDPHKLILRCVIRNQGDQAVRYSDCLLGAWEFVDIKARRSPKAPWRIVALRGQGIRAAMGAGAVPSNVHLLPPKEQMLPMHREGQRQAVAAKRPECTFCVNLWEFDWPSSWTGTVEIAVQQNLGNDGSKDTWARTLESAAVEFPVGDFVADPVAAVTKALLPEGWVVQKVEERTHPFYLEKGSGKAIYVGSPLESVDRSKVKTPHKAVFWIMPPDYRGRPASHSTEQQTETPKLLQSTRTEALYCWGSPSEEVKAAVLSAIYWSTVPSKR